MEVVHQIPQFKQNQMLKRFLVFSAALHVFFFAYLSVKDALFPSKPSAYIPSLRVDLVALPDLKKNDVITPPPPPKEGAKPEEEKKTETEKPKAVAEDDGDFAIRKKKTKVEHQKKEKEAQKKLKAALDRIKALERVKALTQEDNSEVKGNQISKGNSVSAEAKTALEASYSDVVLERVRSNWELPMWLKEQNLSANVIIYIDSRGGLKNFRIVKSSGNPQFDNEVKRTLLASAPFAIPPSDVSHDLATEGIALGFPL